MHLLWACAIASAPVWVGALPHHDCKDVTADDTDEWIEKGGFIILFGTIILCFWGMAVVCEDYYVPALKILCLEYSISDAVAGSTFMAAGASSPELFVSLSALFIEDSSVGSAPSWAQYRAANGIIGFTDSDVMGVRHRMD